MGHLIEQKQNTRPIFSPGDERWKKPFFCLYLDIRFVNSYPPDEGLPFLHEFT